jgi:predicted metal-binding membrane protein
MAVDRDELRYRTRRREKLGALRIGEEHGLYCIACCWTLMLLLFVGGVMNLLWGAVIAAFVLGEKLLPRGPFFARAAGIAFAIWGTVLIARPVIAG